MVRAELAAHRRRADERIDAARRRPPAQALAAVAARSSRPRRCDSGRDGRTRLLIAGRRGIGKRALALALCASAAVRNAARRRRSRAASVPSCRYVAAGQHPDLAAGRAAASSTTRATSTAVDAIAVDRIRELTAFAQLTSHRQRAKVAVIAPAEAMNAAAANALAEDARGAAAGHLPDAGQPSARAPAGDDRQPLPAPAGRRSRTPHRRLAWLAGARRRRRRSGAGAGRRRAAAGARRSPIHGCSASAPACWPSSRGPSALSPVAIGARIDAAREGRAQAAACRARSTGCWPGPPTLRGGQRRSAALPPRQARDALAALAPRVARVPLFRYHQSLLRQRALLAHPLQPRLVAEALLIDYRDLFSRPS